MSLSWKAPFDVNETKDYVRDWTNEMVATADTVLSISFTLPSDALLAGFRITGSVLVPPHAAVMWITCDTPSAGAAFDGRSISVAHTVTTTGGRTYNETILLRVKEK